MWKRILVPHDFSECAARALSVAVDLARRGGASLTLVHVSPLPPNLSGDVIVSDAGTGRPASLESVLTKTAAADLDEIATPMKAQGLEVRTIVRVTTPGSAAAGLLQVARDVRADVIVMGTHGRSGLAHLLLGSVAEKVIRGSMIPVVTVRSIDRTASEAHSAPFAEDELVG